MPGPLPAGDPVPDEGPVPPGTVAGPPGGAPGGDGFGVYVHVPFCASRCGYCDFNTYVPGEGVARDGFVDAVLAEWALAGRVLGGAPPAASVFLGGGTPTLLDDGEIARVLDAIPRRAGRPSRRPRRVVIRRPVPARRLEEHRACRLVSRA